MPPARRTVLALLATTLAGCSTDSRATSPSRTAVTSPTRTTGTSTTRTTATSTARPSGAHDEVETARTHLRAAVAAYVEPAGEGATLLDVTAAGPRPFPRRAVLAECRSAADAIEAGRQKARDAQRRTLADLGATSDFLAASARLQGDLLLLADTLRTLRDAIYGGDRSVADSRQAAVERTLEESNQHADVVRAGDPAAVAGALDALDRDLVGAKQAQFEREDRQLWNLSSALDATTSALSAIDGGWTAWTGDEFEAASRAFGFAVEDCTSAEHHLDGEWTTGFREFGEGLGEVVDALRTGSGRLRDAADEVVADDAKAADRNLDAARAAFRESETVRAEVRAVQPILGDG